MLTGVSWVVDEYLDCKWKRYFYGGSSKFPFFDKKYHNQIIVDNIQDGDACYHGWWKALCDTF